MLTKWPKLYNLQRAGKVPVPSQIKTSKVIILFSLFNEALNVSEILRLANLPQWNNKNKIKDRTTIFSKDLIAALEEVRNIAEFYFLEVIFCSNVIFITCAKLR